MAKKTVATLQTGKEGRSYTKVSKWLSLRKLVLTFLMNKWFLTKKYRTSSRNNLSFEI